jgi:transcriptional regulator with XRE-family HTH domain
MGMGTRERPGDRGRRRLRGAARRLGVEHREARVAAGLSLRAAADASGSPKSQLWRFERGEIDRLSLADLGSWFSVLGLDLSVKVYPAGDALRDAASQRLLERLRSELHPTLRWRAEVALPIEGDLRAWDAEVRGTVPRPWRCRVEAETRVADAQALERKLALKLRDDPGGHLILLLADTRSNRAALPALRAGLRDMLPAGARDVLAALRNGVEPPGSAILLM